MPFTGEAARQVQERLKSLKSIIHKIEEERIRNEVNLNNIIKAQENVVSNTVLDDKEDKHKSHYPRMKSLYEAAVGDAEREEELLRAALSKIYEIRNIRNECRIQARKEGNKEAIRRSTHMKILFSSAQTLPLFVGKPGEKPPALCGAIPAEKDYVAKEGDMVVAIVMGAEEEVNLILAEVVSWNSVTKMYEVDDIDEEKDRHTLSRDRVVPLPLMRANPETDPHALFPKGSVVMALYPQTTCLYKAVVDQLPATATDEYRVLFEDFSYPTGYSPAESVAQRFVIAIDQDNEHA